MAGEHNGRKHNVPEDCAVLLCDEGDERPRLLAQSVDKIGFNWCLERGCVHGMDSSPISRFFSPNPQVPSQADMRHLSTTEPQRHKDARRTIGETMATRSIPAPLKRYPPHPGLHDGHVEVQDEPQPFLSCTEICEHLRDEHELQPLDAFHLDDE